MNASELLRYRLASQQISASKFVSSGEAARWMGIIQAQDFAGGKWALALRTQQATEVMIEQAIADRSLIRTWSARGTLHFMAPEDVHWVNDLIRPRLLASLQTHHRRDGLDDGQALKGLNVLSSLLAEPVKRTALKTQLEQSGFSCEGLRFNHLLVRAAIEGLICLGPREGKEFTYVLRDEWISGKHIKTREEALAEWAFRYFTSHGPATIADFAWWSGLTMNEAKMGLASVEPELARIIFNHETYWMSPKMEPAPAHTVHLLPSFDEFLLGYRDRSLALAKEHLFSVVGSNNGLFKPIIVKNGQVIGIWKRVMIKKEYQIETRFFDGKEVNIKDAIQAVLTYAN